MKNNRFREAVRAGKVPVGHMVWEFATRGIAKVLESADLDFVIYDMEHSGIEIERIFDLIAWAKAAPFAPFVRVPQGMYHFLARVMDAGALGVMVGNVETPEQARDIVNAVKYAPLGKRGVGLGTAHTDFVVPDIATYFRESNESSVVICQIESEIGVRNSEAIAAIEGVDCLWIGHFDLSQSMGIPAQFHSERFQTALRAVISAAQAKQKLLGIQPGSMEQADEWIALGFNVISWSTDTSIYRASLVSGVSQLRNKFATASTA
jgi:2-dehydro-3-deoxyglucarate aldolase/4-hydroxy-2-oxoheptanedioate aldolase